MLPSQQEVSNLLGLLYDAAAEPGLWNLFLAGIAQHTRATSAALVIHDLKNGRCTVSASWELDPERNRLYQAHYHAGDVWAHKLSNYGTSGFVCISESICSAGELRATEFYTDFLAGSGIEHAIFVNVENRHDCLAGISLYRDRSRSEFDDSDLQILLFLIPHLQRAFKFGTGLSAMKANLAGLEAALDTLIAGVIFLGSNGEISMMNRSSAATIAERDGLVIRHGLLVAEARMESENLAKMIQQAISTSDGRGLSAGGRMLISRRTRLPLHLVISPIRKLCADPFRKVAAVVFINDPTRSQRPEQGLLRNAYGLTPAECRIAMLISDGHAPKAIAGMIGVSENTVRSQIKSVFSKTGVKRQAELVRLLLNARPGI